MSKPNHITRRSFLSKCTATAAATGLPLWWVKNELAAAQVAAPSPRNISGQPGLAQPVEPVKLDWLDGKPPGVRQSVSWGVPWPKGRLPKSASFVLKAADGKAIPAQSWPTAFWPDGTIMWSGHSITATPDMAGPLQIGVGAGAEPPVKIACAQDSEAITIETGAMRVRLPKQGPNFIESIFIGERKIAQDGKLVCRLEDRSNFETTRTVREEEFISRIKTVTLEQQGPVRAVVKIEGDHKSASSDRAWLPFLLRLYFGAGLDSIRIVHSFVFDSDGQKDFIKGLGLSFSAPLREEVINRHVRFGGDQGMWAEPVKPMVGRRIITYGSQGQVFPTQLAGRRIPNTDQYAPAQQQYIRDIADWDDYKLTQAGANGFVIEKRTQAKSSWLHVTEGKRALGLAFLGDVTGGIAVDVKKFWQKNPSALEIHGATSSLGELRVWLWSPDAPAMDMRHYDIKGHGLDMAYEDWKEGWDSPLGVANTAELTLWAFSSVPSNADLVKMANGGAEPSLLVCAPRYYHEQRAFGFWSLPDRSSAARRAIEEQNEEAINFYRDEVDQRSWYGLWDYGDMGRMYDEIRHAVALRHRRPGLERDRVIARLLALVQLPAHRPGGLLPARRGHDPEYERSGRSSPRPVCAARLAPQRQSLGRWRQTAAHQPGRPEAVLLLPHHRRTHRRPHARTAHGGRHLCPAQED